jgi:outer membrane usher protein FimD/PapC
MRSLSVPAALLLALLAAPAPAAAQDDAAPLIKTGGRFTSGSGGYRGRSGYVQAGREWKLRASYSGYDFDGSTYTTHTGSLRASYQGEHLTLGLNASVTPRSDYYRSRGWGAEAGWLFTPGDTDESALVDEWDLGAWWTQTRHHQSVPATRALPVQRELIINQHDLGASAAATAWRLTLSVDGYASLYDQDYFALLNQAVAFRPRLADAASLVNSFPENGRSVRLDLEAADWLTPYIALTRVEYGGRQRPTRTAGAGASLRFGDVGAELSYERTKQAGSEDTGYFSAGGSVRF